MNMELKLLSLLPLVLYASVVQIEGTELLNTQHASCCFGSVELPHGKVAMTLAQCCTQLVCNNGRVEKQHIGHLGASRCCEFDGILYPPGYELSVCWPLVCKDGNWTFLGRIEDCCKQCVVYNYNHFVTFDEHHYDWRGSCNYSLAQSDFTQEPHVGVFTDLKSCFGCGSCLGRTTFRNDPNTVVTLNADSVFNLLVNGAAYTVPETGVVALASPAGTLPVLAWRLDTCVVLVGSSRIVLHQCRNRLDVWAHPSHTEGLDGLCGHFNMYVRDDFTDRSNTLHQLEFNPREFPTSWQTDVQSSADCLPGPRVETVCVGSTGKSCLAADPQMIAYRKTCQERLFAAVGDFPELMHYIESCSFDLCLMYANGASQRVIDDWLQNLLDVVHIAGRLLHLAGKTTEITVNLTMPEASTVVTVFTTGYTVVPDTSLVTSLADAFITVLTYYEDDLVTSTITATTTKTV